MAANLQKHGYDLVVFNRTRAKAKPLIDNGATFTESPAKVAEQVESCSQCWRIRMQWSRRRWVATAF
jgi:3-hydroxyisobutyrate dehydrogenase-like beta-hydroxyacid dehydrogenase